MDPDESLCTNSWAKSSLTSSEQQSCANFSSQQQKWGDSAVLDYRVRTEQQFSEFSRPCKISSSVVNGTNNLNKNSGHEENHMKEESDSNNTRDWDPRGLLSNLSFLEQKIHQLQELVHLIVARRDQSACQSNEILVQQQQLITADLISIIVQLISTAGSLLPSVKHTCPVLVLRLTNLGSLVGP